MYILTFCTIVIYFYLKFQQCWRNEICLLRATLKRLLAVPVQVGEPHVDMFDTMIPLSY
jgi:hypothetical protein